VTRKAQVDLLLTQRAIADLVEVFNYSTRQWGQRTGEKYLDDLEAGLERISRQPDLLQSLPDLCPALRFYRVHKHVFACDVQPGSVVVLTVLSGSMDIPQRLAELQPTLATEVELLHENLRRSKRRKS
jgi:toxin ParE1/3/4